MSRYSKYNQTSTRRPTHKKRSIQIAGSGEDDGKYWRCWYCGFINRIDRAALGQGEGINYYIGVESHEFTSSGNVAGQINTTLANRSGKAVLMNNQAFSERHNVVPDVVSGCAFCGSLNWR